jgi:hypothetical protein
MECHRCKHSGAIKSGKFARMDYQDTPCAACELTENSDYTIEYDPERESRSQNPPSFAEAAADKTAGMEVRMRNEEHASGFWVQGKDGEPDEEVLPISVMREIVAALLTMPTEIRNAVCWRYAGFEYRDVAKVQNCSLAAVEIRHTRALRRWPVLKALFPEKVARQARRAALAGSRERRAPRGKREAEGGKTD